MASVPNIALGDPSFPVADAGVVDIDLPCRKCAYNVRGLSLDGRCPECGSAVGLSAKGDLLRYSDPQWVLELRRGTRLILAGIALAVVGMLAGMAVPLLQAVGGLAGSALTLVGSWLMTEPDPSGLGEREYGTARKIIRISLATGLVNSMLEFGTSVSSTPVLGGGIVLPVVQFALGIVGVVGMFAQLLYLKRLAFRIPDAELAARSHFLMYAIGVCYGLFLVIALVAAVLIWTANLAGSGAMMGIGIVAAVLGLALLIFGVMYIFLLWRLGKRFGEQAALAQASWASASSVAGAPSDH